MIRVNLNYSTPSQNKLVTTIKFESVPTSAVATMPTLKYNKKNQFALDGDDMLVTAPDILTLFNSRFFTDGCGNNKNYRFSLAINGANPFDGQEYTFDGSNNTQTTKTVMDAILASGGDLSSHGYWHYTDNPSRFGFGTTPTNNILLCEDFIRRTFNGYKSRNFIVPSADAGYADASVNLGEQYVTSQGAFDGRTPIGQYDQAGNFSIYNPNVTAILGRAFTDSWNTDATSLIAKINAMKSQTNYIFRVGTHNINNLTSFTSVINALDDTFLVTTTRESLEYQEMKNQPITQRLVGDTLTIEVDLAGLSDKIRWQDMSFLITSDKQIQSVSTNGTSSSFNSTTGLVNVFKELTFIPTENTIPREIELMFNNVYSVNQGLNSDGQQVTDGQVIQTVPDRGTEGNKPLIKKGVVGKLGAVVYRSQLGGYEQFLNQEGTYRENDVLFTTDQPFPREVFEVFNQSNFKTFETWKNKTDYPIPSTHSAFYYTGDAGDDDGVRYRDSNDSAPAGSANSIPSAFVPINQNILFHTKYTQDGTGIKAELRINKVLQGSCYTFSDGRLLRPRMGFGATSNVANYGMAWMGHKIGSFTDSERTDIENALYSKYNIGQRVPCPLALNLVAHKSGTVYTAGYNYDPYMLPQDTAKRSVRWVLLTSVGIQSGIYHTAVDGMMTWDSNTYPIPSGYTVSNVEVIVGDTSETGNKYYVPQKSYLS